MKQLCSLALAACLFMASCSPEKKSSGPVYATDCAHSLAGTYTGSDICASSGGNSYPATIVANTATNITINFLYSVPVVAELNCTNNSLTILAQTFAGSFTISGTGTYTANTIVINWNGSYAGAPISCTTTYVR